MCVYEPITHGYRNVRTPHLTIHKTRDPAAHIQNPPYDTNETNRDLGIHHSTDDTHCVREHVLRRRKASK